MPPYLKGGINIKKRLKDCYRFGSDFKLRYWNHYHARNYRNAHCWFIY